MLKSYRNPIKLLILTLILSLCVSESLRAQQQERSFFDNVRFGGSLNLGFGDGFFTAGLAPQAIYDFDRYWSAGVGLSGNYTNADNFEAYTGGTSLIGFFRPYRGIRLSVEYEQLFVNIKEEFNNQTFERDYTYPALFLGFGYSAGPVTAGIRYDVLYDERDSIYGSALVPFVTVYF